MKRHPHPPAASLSNEALSNRIARVDLRIILAADCWIGGGWLIGRPAYSSSLSFHPAKELLSFLPFYPMRAWGGLLLALALLGLIGTLRHKQEIARSCAVLVSAFWAFFAFTFFVAMFAPNAPITAVGFAVVLTTSHYRAAISTHFLSASFR